MLPHRLSRIAPLLLLAAALLPARAHDTWFEASPRALLALGTGNRFPAQETGIDRSFLVHQGCIAEMRTGEGKTLTATLPTYLNALSGRGVHVVTVNDYLASPRAS